MTHFKWLKKEVPRWVKEEIITREAGDSLISLYRNEERHSHGEGLHLTEELLQGDFRRIENHLITDGGPLALVGHHPFLQSYLLEAAGAGIQPDLASISVVDYDMAWKQGKLIAYFTPALKKLKKED